MIRTSILVLVLASYFASALSILGDDGYTLPIKRKTRSQHAYRPEVGAIGLGDIDDLSYTVDIDINGHMFPVLLDTGSSDLWVISTECNSTSCGMIDSAPEINISGLNYTGFDVGFVFGTSTDSALASGKIVSGPVGIAGLPVVYNQTFAAVNFTNTSLPSLGLSGIFGLGFPYPDSADITFNLLVAEIGGENALFNLSGPERTRFFISNIDSISPLVPTMIINGILKHPMFSITLERETILPGGDVGEIILGGLPKGIDNESLTWAPVRLYQGEAQGGLDPPSSNPNEFFPNFWEVPLDDVVLNGVKLPKPKLQENVTYTAVIDSGTAGFAAPPEVLKAILDIIGIGGNSSFANISCTEAVELTFIISGKQFKVDPLDIIGGASSSSSDRHCNSSSFLEADPPSTGALFSWIIGDPFMKSNLVVFYYGNLTHPSSDQPRIGFHSTVPSNASEVFSSAIAAALSTDSVSFINSVVAAPTGTFSATATNTDGVAQNPTGTPYTLSDTTAGMSTYSNAASNAELKNDLIDNTAASSSDSDVQKLLKYAPIVLGLLAVTTILTMISVIFGIVSLCKRRSGLMRNGTPSADYHSLHVAPTKFSAGYRDVEGDRDDAEPMLG